MKNRQEALYAHFENAHGQEANLLVSAIENEGVRYIFGVSCHDGEIGTLTKEGLSQWHAPAEAISEEEITSVYLSSGCGTYFSPMRSAVRFATRPFNTQFR
ncbi:hypothetical protein [Rhizobium leguminosarum]|uniref:hypothetical protein n=1 Tax=Rhizobium leguminosarum TaxID=384 RepID=UPI0014421B50|nr:hypothetical protein [Rhizobium leguminosarum]NKK80532.1 hypothetical protein [Rhizobium leguminosarum bv. viciae]